MRAITGLWRWRHNPLRRRTDVAEGWIALATPAFKLSRPNGVATTAASFTRSYTTHREAVMKTTRPAAESRWRAPSVTATPRPKRAAAVAEVNGPWVRA